MPSSLRASWPHTRMPHCQGSIVWCVPLTTRRNRPWAAARRPPGDAANVARDLPRVQLDGPPCRLRARGRGAAGTRACQSRPPLRDRSTNLAHWPATRVRPRRGKAMIKRGAHFRTWPSACCEDCRKRTQQCHRPKTRSSRMRRDPASCLRALPRARTAGARRRRAERLVARAGRACRRGRASRRRRGRRTREHLVAGHEAAASLSGGACRGALGGTGAAAARRHVCDGQPEPWG